MQAEETNSVMWNNWPRYFWSINFLIVSQEDSQNHRAPRVLFVHVHTQTHTLSHCPETLGTHALSTTGDSTSRNSLTEWEQRGSTRAHQLGHEANQMCERGSNERQFSCSHSCWECKKPPAQEEPTYPTQLPPVPRCFFSNGGVSTYKIN